MGAALGAADPEARGAPQPEMLASQVEHAGVELAHLLASTGVLSRERSRERTRATADVQHAARTCGVQGEPQPADVVELKVGDVRKVNV